SRAGERASGGRAAERRGSRLGLLLLLLRVPGKIRPALLRREHGRFRREYSASSFMGSVGSGNALLESRVAEFAQRKLEKRLRSPEERSRGRLRSPVGAAELSPALQRWES